jgi:hypothetical protein
MTDTRVLLRRAAVSTLTALSCAVLSARAQAQSAQACHSRDAYAEYHINSLRQIASANAPDLSAWRDRQHLPADTSIALVDDPETCDLAREAYNDDAELGDQHAAFVYVVKVGNVYVVSNPAVKSGDFPYQFVYSDDFQLLSAFLKYPGPLVSSTARTSSVKR